MRACALLVAAAAAALLAGVAAQADPCEREHRACVATDCADALRCADACGDASCIISCSTKASSAAGASALRRYQRCAQQAAEHPPVRGEATVPAAPAVPEPAQGGAPVDSDAERRMRKLLQPAADPALPASPPQPAPAGQEAVEGAVEKVAHAVDRVAAEAAVSRHPPQPALAEQRFRRASSRLDPLKLATQAAAVAAGGSAQGAVAGVINSMAMSTARQGVKPEWSDKEACLGCTFVWETVASKMGASPSYENMAQTFETTCQDQPDIFYGACDDMFDMEPHLIDFFLKGMRGEQLCTAAQICWPGLMA